MNTQESNKIIAEFLGWSYDWTGTLWAVPTTSNLIPECEDYKSGTRVPDEKLEFHSNWQWLMPVVEKIEALGYRVSIERWLVQILEENSTDIFGLINAMAEKETDTKINLTVKAVVEFIQYYNTHNKK